MANTKQLGKDVKLKVLAYGKSGTGKTTFGGSFPDCWFADFDNGMLSLRGRDIEYTTYHEAEPFMEDLTKIEKGTLKCETVVVDSVTTLEKYALDSICKLNNRTEPTLHEWGRLIAWYQDLFMRLTKLDKHVVVIAHEQMIQDGITGEVLVRPLIVGKKLPGQLPLYFDEVYRLQATTDSKTKTTNYQMMTTADTRYTAKSRLNVLETLETPDFKTIITKLKGEKS